MNISNIALGGYHQAEKLMETAAGKIARLPLTATTPPAQSADLPTAMVELVQAQRSAEANLKVLKTADEVTRHTLDVFG
ncbi:MAG: hypothetical protein IPP47_10415 [Bryobacterales bacterium]|nr:hypothetical protein [Bryobacterales bacterium]